MARRPKQPDPVPAEPGAPPDPSLEVTPDDVEALEELIAQLGPDSGARVTVYYRPIDGHGRFAHCRRLPLQDFDLDRIADEFGSGDYSFTVYARGQERQSFTTRVLRAPKPAATAPAPSTEIATLQATVHTLQTSIEAARDRHIAMLERIAEKAMGGGGGLKERVEELKAVSDLLGLGANKGSSTKETLEAVNLGIELAAKVAGGGGSAEDLGILDKILDKVGPVVAAALVERMSKPRGPALPAAPVPPVTPPEIAASTPPPAITPGATGMPLPGPWARYEFLREHVPELLKWASGSRPPQLLAELCYQETPETYLDDLDQFVHLEPAQRGELLTMLDSRLIPFLGYIEKIAAELLVMFDTDDQAEAASVEAPAVTN